MTTADDSVADEPGGRVPPMEETMRAILKTFAEIEVHLQVIGRRLGVPPELLVLDPAGRRTLG